MCNHLGHHTFFKPTENFEVLDKVPKFTMEDNDPKIWSLKFVCSKVPMTPY